MKSWLLALAWLAAFHGHAAPAAGNRTGSFSGTVSHVTDGDTLWVRPAGGGAPVEIRLLDLDAPEGCQLFGKESKKALRQRVLDQPVRVRTRGVDDYQRQLANVQHRGADVGAWMVRHGYAWSSTFRGKPGPYARLEARARDRAPRSFPTV